MTTSMHERLGQDQLDSGRDAGRNRTLIAAILGAVLASSALPVTAQSKIVIEGDAAFVQKVQAAIQAIKDANDPEGELRALIEALEMSANCHVIRQTDTEQGSHCKPDDPKKEKDRSGTGTTIEWEADSTDLYDTDVARDPTAALLHELAHAAAADQGLATDETVPGPDGPIDQDEQYAVVIENIYRDAVNIPERTKYGNRELPP